MIDVVTLLVFLLPFAAWFVWELVVLILRGLGKPGPPKTISMVARDVGRRFTCVPYLWFGLGAHFWWTGAWASVAGSIAFWLVAVLLLVVDCALLAATTPEAWPRWLYWCRHPVVWMVLGVAAGRFLFPQATT